MAGHPGDGVSVSQSGRSDGQRRCWGWGEILYVCERERERQESLVSYLNKDYFSNEVCGTLISANNGLKNTFGRMQDNGIKSFTMLPLSSFATDHAVVNSRDGYRGPWREATFAQALAPSFLG